jgi:hypothetical protein
MSNRVTRWATSSTGRSVTAAVEPASGHDFAYAGDRIDNREALRGRAALHRAEARNRGEQCAGIGLPRRCEKLCGGCLLDGVAIQHHDRAIRDLGHHTHVMGDEGDRHALLVLQQFDQLEDFGLDRNVERGRRFVRDQQLRLAGERHRDHHALAHAAGEPVRILVQARLRGRDAHALQDAQRFGLRARSIEAAMVDQRFGDLEAEGQYRVEAGHRLLKDHRNQVAAHIAHPVFG